MHGHGGKLVFWALLEEFTTTRTNPQGRSGTLQEQEELSLRSRNDLCAQKLKSMQSALGIRERKRIHKLNMQNGSPAIKFAAFAFSK